MGAPKTTKSTKIIANPQKFQVVAIQFTLKFISYNLAKVSYIASYSSYTATPQ